MMTTMRTIKAFCCLIYDPIYAGMSHGPPDFQVTRVISIEEKLCGEGTKKFLHISIAFSEKCRRTLTRRNFLNNHAPQ